MRKEYSLYEAKAKLSALVRLVREGQSVVITLHGAPVAELRAFVAAEEPQSLEARYEALKSIGAISSATRTPREAARAFQSQRVPGALQRFLDSRD